MLDVLVHIDAEDIAYVYQWRLQQEHALIAAKGQGMSDDSVREFVNGCECFGRRRLRWMDADACRYACV
jgi:pantothenate kinase-related protein Tda10